MTVAAKIICPHCKGSGRMSDRADFGPCLWCEGDGQAGRQAALHYAEISREMAFFGVLKGEMSVERAGELRREAEAIFAAFGGRAT